MATAAQRKLWREKFAALYVSPELHQALKMAAALEHRDMKDMVETLVTAYLKYNHPSLLDLAVKASIAAEQN